MSGLTRADLVGLRREVESFGPLRCHMTTKRAAEVYADVLVDRAALRRLLAWCEEADAALKFICEMEDTSICECEECSCDIGAMAEAARAARLPEGES